jgi:hypothetical protein
MSLCFNNFVRVVLTVVDGGSIVYRQLLCTILPVACVNWNSESKKVFPREYSYVRLYYSCVIKT